VTTCTQQTLRLDRIVQPTWAYDEFENLEKVSTNRGDFKVRAYHCAYAESMRAPLSERSMLSRWSWRMMQGIWGSHNKKVIHVDELRTGGHKFEETSSHRAAFVEYKDAVPRERIE